jgi:hypothetical protein
MKRGNPPNVEAGIRPVSAVVSAVQTHSFLHRPRSYTTAVVESSPNAAKEKIV